MKEDAPWVGGRQGANIKDCPRGGLRDGDQCSCLFYAKALSKPVNDVSPVLCLKELVQFITGFESEDYVS